MKTILLAILIILLVIILLIINLFKIKKNKEIYEKELKKKYKEDLIKLKSKLYKNN